MTVPVHGADAVHDLSGTYVLTSQNITMTLLLRQDAQGALTGTLSITRGAQFEVEGRVKDGVGVGTCVGNQGGSYFEAHPEGEQLRLALIEPGPNNAPDYSNVRKTPVCAPDQWEWIPSTAGIRATAAVPRRTRRG